MCDLENSQKIEPRKYGTQIFAAASAAIGGFAMGSCLSYSSPALPSLKNSTTFASITLDESSWFASLAPLAAMVACPFMGLFVEHMGRKGSILLMTIPLLLGWILIAFADSLVMLYAGRFLTGFAAGAYGVGVPIFINETAHESIRGRLALLTGLGVHTGICFPYITGSFLAYNFLAMSLTAIPIMIVAMMSFVVESPRYLLAKGEIKKASMALIWLRGVENVQDELDLMKKAIDENKEEKLGLRDMVTSAAILKPTGLCLALLFFLVVSGIDVVIFYSYTIFKESGTNLSPNLSSCVVGGMEVMAMFLSSFLVDRIGRRPLLLVSQIVIFITLAVLGLFFYLSKSDELVRDTFGWLPLVCLILFALGYSSGLGPICFIYLEILPTRVAGTATGIACCFSWAAAFVIIRFFENVNEELGREWPFWIFAIWTLVGIFFVYFFIPETKGKTLEEIQVGFQ